MKKIVLISPKFFNLSDLIKDEIIRQGYDCHWFNDRISDRFIDKVLIRISKWAIQKKIDRYFEEISEYCIKEQPDILLTIYGQSFTGEQFAKLKERLPNTEFVFFSWDSADIYPIIKGKFQVFDRSYTFDTDDVDKYHVHFLPLFYSYKYSQEPIAYDYSFIGTIKPGKYQVIHELTAQLNKHFFKSYVYMFLQSPMAYHYYRLKSGEFRHAKKKEFRYDRLDAKTVNTIFLQSNIVVDVAMANQNGLTIRTLEALHLKKKLITNNTNIRKYPFYNEKNILVYEGGELNFDSPFFTEPFDETSALSHDYSIEHFVHVLLGVQE